MARFKFYDPSFTGYIEQSDLKTVLADLSISLTLS